MTMTLEMTEKQRHRAMRQMREDGYPMDEQPEPSQYTKYFHDLLDERAKNRELEKTLAEVNAQRISAEATRFAALHILEDIVRSSGTDPGDEDGYAVNVPGWSLVTDASLDRARALVAAHRGSSELPR